MSKKSSAKKPGFNDANELLYDPYPNYVAAEYFPLDLPWPEWNDSEINSEKWDEGKSKPATKSTGKTESLHSLHFEDPLPPTLKDVAEWKRPSSYFPAEQKILLYDPENVDFELSIPSESTCGKKLFKLFVELIPILRFYALKEKFPVECESPTFFPNTQGESWKPWHHIYALCKAGKGQTHKPMYCPYGKYVVRLFYMGAWRRFLVDDKIPCDEDGNCMLPVNADGELWPIILMKALLKIPNAEDVPFLMFFTGWLDVRMPVVSKDRDEIWGVMEMVLKKWKEEGGDGVKPVFVVAELRRILEDEDHEIALTMSRDQPLSNAGKKDATPAWKRFRWVYWASKKGIWTDELLIPPYRCLLLITFLQKIHEELFIDPDLENRLFDSTTEENTPRSELTGPEQWSDFTKVAKYLSNLHLCYKPSSFPYKLKATYIRKPDKTGKGPADSYFLTPSVTLTKNEPAYLYCESLAEIFILISLTVCPKDVKKNLNPEIIKKYHGSLIVEEFDWRTLEEQKILGVIKTSGNDVLQLKLEPGRQVVKLWLDTDSPFMLQIYSNTEITLFKGSKIRFLMSRESERILGSINEISAGFSNLILKFGKPEWRDGLFEFYKCLKVKDLDGFMGVFFQCLVNFLRDMVAAEELSLMIGALRALFADITIGEVKKYSVEDIGEVDEDENQKAMTIQRHFRGYRIRLLFKRQNPNRKEFKPYCDKLKKLSDLILSPAKKEAEVGRLLREIIRMSPEINFEFKDGIPKVLQLDEFTGKMNILDPNAWTLFTRFTFVCHADDPVPCAFFFSCNLKYTAVIVIDNDTNSEIFKLTTDASPNYYSRNKNGFTLIAFGWNENYSKVANWRMEMVRLKHYPMIHPCNVVGNSPCVAYQPPNLQAYELRNFYVPNRRNIICRCLIRIKKRTLVTVRFFVSQENVHLEAKITQGLRKSFSNLDLGFQEHVFEELVIIENETKKSAIIFPAVILEHEKSLNLNGEDPSCVYTFEAVVKGGTWPLTPQEWGVVEPMRTGCEPTVGSPMPLGSRKRSTRMSKRSLKTMDNPNWCLQIYTEDSIVLEEDRTRLEALKAMKEHWEENEPGRRANGTLLREDFLKEVFGGHEEEFETLLRQMKSFSYLLQDPSVDRTLISPRVIPKTPFEDLVEKFGYQMAEAKITRVESVESVIEEIFYYTKKYHCEIEKLDHNRLSDLEKSKKRRNILENHIEEERKLSNELMEEAYETRMKIIQRLVKNKSFNR